MSALLDSTERTSFGLSLVAHGALIAALSVGLMAAPEMIDQSRAPMEVALVEEVGLESGAPVLSAEAPAPRLSEVEAPLEPLPPSPAPVVQPQPQPQPQPRAAPAEAPRRPAPKPVKAAPPAPKKAQAPPKQAARSGGRLSGLLEGISDRDSDSRSTTPPASQVTAAVQSSLAAEVRRQLRPHWRPPTGADVQLLKTRLRIELARDGSVRDVEFLGTDGINASNRPQAQLHRERAIRAVRLAAPFKLPAQFYDGWKSMTVNFDQRLSS